MARLPLGGAPGGREVGRRSEVSQVVQGWIVVGPGVTGKA